MISNSKTRTIGTEYCMCGCGHANKPGRRFSQGHDASFMRCLRLIEEGELDGSAISVETVKEVRENPNLGVGRFSGDDILRLESVRFGHAEASRRFMRQAHVEFKHRDLLQASEKAWGAAAQAVKAAAARRGLPHGKHRDLIRAVTHLAIETRQEDLRRNFHVAEALHANFYEDWMPTEMVRSSISDVERFLTQMKPLHDE